MPNMVTLTVGGPHLFVLMTFENVKTPHIHRRWETPRTTNLPEKKFFFQPKMKKLMSKYRKRWKVGGLKNSSSPIIIIIDCSNLITPGSVHTHTLFSHIKWWWPCFLESKETTILHPGHYEFLISLDDKNEHFFFKEKKAARCTHTRE